MNNNLHIAKITEYSELLCTYGLEFSADGPYWQLGKIEKTQGWIIHLSVVLHQLQELLELIVPELVARNIPFKIIMTEELARRMLDGGLGYIQLGKMVRIYPENDTAARGLAEDLIHLTRDFHGPAIPTDKLLGSIVYTRYGSFSPVEVIDTTGQAVKCIYNSAGQLMADPYTVPFLLPGGVTWPYGYLGSPALPKQPKLLNGRYYPFSVIKPDVKGKVIRALYFKKPWQISICIIKEGYPHMFEDAAGRDIRDRLKWQYDLYHDLHEDIPLPKVFDYFIMDETAYLAMEFIKGIQLTSWISNIYNSRSWLYLSRLEKILLLDKLLELLDIIDKMHKRDYVHRDITPDNFLINKKGQIFLVDLELAWSSRQHRPNPPFRLGTPGHMSPEQQLSQTPTVKEDIYAIGGLMVMIFTNMHAAKFHLHSPEAIRSVINFITGEQIVGDLVAACLKIPPSDRPDLSIVTDTLQHYRGGQLSEAIGLHAYLSNPWKSTTPDEFVQMGISGLASQQFLNPKQRWISRNQKKDSYIGNEQMELTLSEGWHTGMTGVLWLVARARNMDLKVDDCLHPYAQSWEYLFEHFFPQVQNQAPGLYNGAAGVAMALVEGIKARLLTMDEYQHERLCSCFSHKSRKFCLADGLAGQGLSLLNTSGYLDRPFFETTLKGYVTEILAGQLADGSWNTGIKDSNHRVHTFTGMNYGISGIVWFLLCYFRKYPDSEVGVAAKKALYWLSKYYQKRDGQYGWSISIGKKGQDIWQWDVGTPGITHTFIKAYEIWKDPCYKALAEEALYGIPVAPSMMDWSLSSGLSGLGEVYLDAAQTFDNNEWQQRSDWIIALLERCSILSEDLKITWLSGFNTTPTADLFTGSGGILHFFMRHLRQEKSSYPLWV